MGKDRPKKDDPLTAVLKTFRSPETSDWANAWIGMEPTFQSRKSIKKWAEMSASSLAGEDAYFLDEYMLDTQKDVGKSIVKRYKACLEDGDDWCMFQDVEREEEVDPWGVRRQNIEFHWADDSLKPFEVRFTIDPETFEYSIKPVPVAWFYDERWVSFLEEVLWRAPAKNGLAPSIAHGGAQFSLSAKTFLTGSLLADDIADRLNHPELSQWTLDWPNPDDRAFRATRERLQAFRAVLDQYWAGAFHPKAIGVLTPLHCYLDRGFEPAPSPAAGLVDPKKGPTGSPQEVFLTNFAFGRAVRLRAQNVHPGYWQAAHPKEQGYRPDQIMRYSEGNLNRLQIAGEFHVKSGKVLDPERLPDAHAPLAASMLYDEASWEDRGQMGRTSAQDFVEALLLDVHRAQWLQAHPHVKVSTSLLQDQILVDAEETLAKRDAKLLGRLRKEAEALNLASSSGRLRSAWVEPETLFWASWKALPAAEQGAIAREVVGSFARRVHEAASVDPRASRKGKDPMEWHRHRIHPVLWRAIEEAEKEMKADDPVRREWEAWKAAREELLARRPVFSHVDLRPPWE